MDGCELSCVHIKFIGQVDRFHAIIPGMLTDIRKILPWTILACGMACAQIQILSEPGLQIAPEGGSARFQLVLQSASGLTVKWYKLAAPNDIAIEPGQRFSMQLQPDPRRPIYIAVLTIDQLVMSDMGQYYCLATDTSGQVLRSGIGRLVVQGLVAHWPLDQDHCQQGIFMDRALDHHAYTTGGQTFVTGPNGSPAGAISLKGPNGWATVEPFDPTYSSGQVSLCLWIRILERVEQLPSGLDPNRPLQVLDSMVTDSAWHHICLAYDGHTITSYLDGRPQSRADASTPATDQILGSIGLNVTDHWPYGCLLSDVRIYNKAIDVSDVVAIYEQMVNMLEVVDAGARSVHDPAIIRQGDVYYLFSTGRGIPIRRSWDLRHWEVIGRVFEDLPTWIPQEVPEVSNLWAPDISLVNGVYHLYYSASTFGSNRSCIGLATNVTLDPADPNYRWLDQGKVIGSTKQSDYNTIDGNLIKDHEGLLWLAFGSFWTGIKLTQLDPATGKPFNPANLFSIASRPSTAIEAPFVIFKHGYYYLFVSFDQCCRGVDSTYNIRVGRARQITGPYLDRTGLAMTAGGGNLVLASDQRWKGPGHNAVLMDDGQDYLVYHAYDALDNGRSALRIRPLYWSDDLWPLPGPTITISR